MQPILEIDHEELIKWLAERRDNCLRIAEEKTGEDRLGWLIDAAYFDQALKELRAG